MDETHHSGMISAWSRSSDKTLLHYEVVQLKNHGARSLKENRVVCPECDEGMSSRERGDLSCSSSMSVQDPATEANS